MGAWGTSAFESDGGLDFLGNLGDHVAALMAAGTAADSTEPVMELLRRADAAEYEDEAHAAAELLAAVLADGWPDYRIGGGSGLMRQDGDGRPWLPEGAIALVPVLRSGLWKAGEGDLRIVKDAAERYAASLDTAAAKTRATNPGGWGDAEARALALEATAARLRKAAG